MLLEKTFILLYWNEILFFSCIKLKTFFDSNQLGMILTLCLVFVVVVDYHHTTTTTIIITITWIKFVYRFSFFSLYIRESKWLDIVVHDQMLLLLLLLSSTFNCCNNCNAISARFHFAFDNFQITEKHDDVFILNKFFFGCCCCSFYFLLYKMMMMMMSMNWIHLNHTHMKYLIESKVVRNLTIFFILAHIS